MKFTSRGMRRRRQTDKWEVVLSHRDPVTGDQIPSYHTIEAKTEKQAKRKRDNLIMELERKGAAAGSNMLLAEFLSSFVSYKEKVAVVELSTIRGYRHEAKLISRYIGDMKVSDLHIAEVNAFMADITADGYSPKSVASAFRLLKQSLKWAMAQDLITKDPCDYCKPPKRAKPHINALDRDAKRAAVVKVAESFDVDMSAVRPIPTGPASPPAAAGITFTVEQLEAMLAQAKSLENGSCSTRDA